MSALRVPFDHFARLRTSLNHIDAFWAGYQQRSPHFPAHFDLFASRLDAHLSVYPEDLTGHRGTRSLAVLFSAITSSNGTTYSSKPPLWLINFDPMFVVSVF